MGIIILLNARYQMMIETKAETESKSQCSRRQLKLSRKLIKLQSTYANCCDSQQRRNFSLSPANHTHYTTTLNNIHGSFQQKQKKKFHNNILSFFACSLISRHTYSVSGRARADALFNERQTHSTALFYN